MRKVYLKESSIEMLASKKPLTFLKFYNELIKFIRGLLNSPIDARPSEILVSNGFNNGKLRHLLVQFGIVKKSEDIDEPIMMKAERRNLGIIYRIRFQRKTSRIR